MLRRVLLLCVLLACGFCHAALSYSNAFTSPRNTERARRKSTNFIILHTTEAEAASSLRKLSRNGEAHYCVDRDGKVYRIVNRDRVAYHCGTSMWNGRRNLDEVSIGIEVVGYHDRALTSAQYTAIRELVLNLQKLYAVADANVMPHSQVAYGTPNRWHRKSHRGRKRCGMGYATPGVRSLLGLKSRWLADPDVKARRLTVGDTFLEDVLYAKNGTALLPYKLPTTTTAVAKAAPAAKSKVVATGKTKATLASKVNKAVAQLEENTRLYFIKRGQTAWDVARDAYDANSTLYIFPDGKRITGDKIRDWESLVVGTRVIVGDGEASGSPVQTLLAGSHPRKLVGDAVFAKDTWYLRPTGGYVSGAKLTEKALSALPPGTKILVGYAVGGPVNSRNLPAQICPSRYDAPDTFYLIPGKPLQAAKDINKRRVPAGTLIFYRD